MQNSTDIFSENQQVIVLDAPNGLGMTCSNNGTQNLKDLIGFDATFQGHASNLHVIPNGQSSHKGMKLKSYSIEFKLKAIAYAEEKGNHAAGREYKVDRKSIRTWRKSKDKLLELSAGSTGGATRKRLKGGGRKVHDAKFEKILIEWVYAVASEGHKISGPVLIAHAQQLQKNHKDANGLNFSNGWLEKFINRNKLHSLMSSEQSGNVNRTLSQGGQQKPLSHFDQSVDLHANSMIGIVQNRPSFDIKTESPSTQQNNLIVSQDVSPSTKELHLHSEKEQIVNSNRLLLMATEDRVSKFHELDHDQPPVFILDD